MKLKHIIQFLDLKYNNHSVRNLRKNNFITGVSNRFFTPTCSTITELSEYFG